MVLTDPPFGANVMYSELIDFFHVWNYKSTLAEELGFDAPLSPKSNEIIVNETRNLTQKDYSQGLEQVFAECHRVIKDNGFLIFSFHDKSLDSWRSLLESVDKAGFNLVRTYPLHSETRTGAHTSNKNSIALDIMLIYKKKTVPDVAFNIETEQKIYREALEETESVVKRLSDINAEMTIPDIQNIFLSEYFCGWSNKGYCIHDVFNNLLDSIKEATDNISNYFQDISIASKRTGWWSELYNQKWDV
jgi:adenine-specific DNA methylase